MKENHMDKTDIEHKTGYSDETESAHGNVHGTPAEPTEDQTIPEIKAYLDAHKISYASSASKLDLLALVNK